MHATIYKRFCDIAYEAAGIRLGAGKQALVDARVGRRLRHLGIDTPREYLGYMESDETGKELAQFLDAITTNFTSFCREPSHFEFLTQWLKTQLPPRQARLRVWCAAAATGEEPYTLAITLLEALGGRSSDAKILATDISTRALSRARQGIYPKKTIEPLSASQRSRFLEQDARGDYRITEEPRKLLTFRRLNLSTPPFPMKGPFDFVFCRNVMIYFDQPIRQALVSNIEKLLAPGGYLITGHSETLAGLQTGLALVRPSIYQKSPHE